MLRPRLRTLNPREVRSIRHWAIELAIVVVGVLLALWTAEWAQGRRDAREHAETMQRVDAMITRTQAISSARVATSSCLMARLAELDAALKSGAGTWTAMPLANVPDAVNANSIYPIVYLANGIDLPIGLFDVAEENGAFASLDTVSRSQYDAMRQNVRWIADNWQRGWEQYRWIALLGVDGQLDAAARYDIRQRLAALSVENQVAVVRALSLGRQVKEAGLSLSDDDLAVFRKELDFAREVYGNCVVEVDPTTGEPKMPTE
mgnify:CR=1 FL=1